MPTISGLFSPVHFRAHYVRKHSGASGESAQFDNETPLGPKVQVSIQGLSKAQVADVMVELTSWGSGPGFNVGRPQDGCGWTVSGFRVPTARVAALLRIAPANTYMSFHTSGLGQTPSIDAVTIVWH